MPSESDESMIRSLADAGRPLTSRHESPQLYAMEPARWRREGDRTFGRYCSPPEITFRSYAPICSECGRMVEWAGKPRRVKGGWAYRIRCRACGPDVLVSEFRLCIGGSAEFWREMGWNGPG